MTTPDAELDQAPAATATDTTTGTDQAPAAIPAPHVAEQADDGDLDLLDTSEEGEGEGEGAEPQDDDEPEQSTIQPIGPGEDASEEEVAEWRTRHGVPDEPSGYQPPQIEGVNWNQDALGPVLDIVHRHNVPQEALAAALTAYGQQVAAQQVKLAEADKALRTETRDALTQKWAGAYDHRMQVAKEGARLLPPSLRQALKTARTVDGKRVADLPELAEAMLAIGRLTQKGKPVPTSDEERLAEIVKVRDANIDEYYQRGFDKEALEVGRRIAAKGQPAPVALAPADAAEERELVQLMSENVDAYQYRQWRGSGKTGGERLLELRRKRDGAAA